MSGDTLGKLKISTFYQKMGQADVSEEGSALLDIFSYISRFKGDEQAQSIESAEITKTAIDLNKELRERLLAGHTLTGVYRTFTSSEAQNGADW